MTRKKFRAKEPVHEAHTYAEFMAALLAGAVRATQLIEKRANGTLELEYEDPK